MARRKTAVKKFAGSSDNIGMILDISEKNACVINTEEMNHEYRQTVNGPVRLLPEGGAAFVLMTEIDDIISLNGTAIGQWICSDEGPGTGALSLSTAMYCSDQMLFVLFHPSPASV